MRVAFLLEDMNMSGGVNVVVKHASRLSTEHHHEVVLFIQNIDKRNYSWSDLDDSNVKVASLKECSFEKFDVAIATWWETLFNLPAINAEKYVWFCQALEDRFLPADDLIRRLATAVQSVPITCITEASWIQQTLHQVNPNRDVFLVLNGIDKDVFFLHSDSRFHCKDVSTLNLLVEGSIHAKRKGIKLAIEGCLTANVPLKVVHISNDLVDEVTELFGSDIRYEHVKGPITAAEMANFYNRSDLLVKTSKSEGMFGPPLEAFHCGCTSIVTPVNGSEEYIRHGLNSIVVEWDSMGSISSAIETLFQDKQYLRRLKHGALETANSWRNWQVSTSEFAAVLEEIRVRPTRFLRSDLQAVLDGFRSIFFPVRSAQALLHGFVEVADERLKLIHSLQAELSTIRNTSEEESASERFKIQFKSLLERIGLSRCI